MWDKNYHSIFGHCGCEECVKARMMDYVHLGDRLFPQDPYNPDLLKQLLEEEYETRPPGLVHFILRPYPDRPNGGSNVAIAFNPAMKESRDWANYIITDWQNLRRCYKPIGGRKCK